MPHKIAYIVSRFPHLSETFILREMGALERQGWDVSLYPLILQKQQVVHAEAKSWILRAQNIPFISLSIIWENVVRFLMSPRKYLRILFLSLWENRSSLKFLIRTVVLFPKAVYLARLMQNEGVKHIHAHYATHPAFVAWVIHHLSGISYTITVHAHDIFVERTMLEIKLRDAINIRAISKFNREFLLDIYGPWLREKINVIHCGIDPTKFKPRADAFESSDEFTILSIGSLQSYKGFPYLIEACSILQERGIFFRCKIIGGGEEQASLANLIATYKLESVVELLGPLPQDEVAKHLPLADCYVQPSIITPEGKMEGIPVALMEALACGLPVVSSSVSGIPELVIAGETGFLVPPADARELAGSLEEVYSNIDRARAFGQAGRELVINEFDLDINTKELATMFEQDVFTNSGNIR